MDPLGAFVQQIGPRLVHGLSSRVVHNKGEGGTLVQELEVPLGLVQSVGRVGEYAAVLNVVMHEI
jgi:hypothetical protein